MIIHSSEDQWLQWFDKHRFLSNWTKIENLVFDHLIKSLGKSKEKLTVEFIFVSLMFLEIQMIKWIEKSKKGAIDEKETWTNYSMAVQIISKMSSLCFSFSQLWKQLANDFKAIDSKEKGKTKN